LNPKNPRLRDRVRRGKIKVNEFVEMRPEEMYPELWQPYKELLEQKHNRNAVNLQIEREGLFHCGKCKSRNTDYSQMQTSSADEPMTSYIYCYNCGHRWKQK
jgi:transcription elongation factor S-II